MNVYLESDFFKEFIYSGEIKLIYALAILMVIDMITGILKSLKNGNIWSRKSTYGFGRKMLVFLIIIVANIIDTLFSLNGVLIYGSVIFYILNECLSIIENYALMGGKVPEQLLNTLELLKERNDLTDRIEQRVKVNDNVTIEVKKESDNNEHN